jgi:hypothetical protein
MEYIDHLAGQNIWDQESGDQEFGDQESRDQEPGDQEPGDQSIKGSTKPLQAICPITLTGIDAKDLTSAITVITDSCPISETDRATLKAMQFIVPRHKNITIHHVSTYGLADAKHWFIDRRGQEPKSRRHLDQNELNRISFRYRFREVLARIPAREKLQDLFILYCRDLVAETVDVNSENFILLRCHLTPEIMPNFFPLERKEAETTISRAVTSGRGLRWIVRPSKFKGYDFARDNQGNLYRMTEYMALTYHDPGRQKYNHILIEKIFSKGYFLGGGQCHGQVLDYVRGEGAVCFFDILHLILSKGKFDARDCEP